MIIRHNLEEKISMIREAHPRDHAPIQLFLNVIESDEQ